ncbi:magnesium transporter MgtE N-terminal domain-containing protein [Actinacidiphila guanduensis]|uniref:Mg/Co/Ni transporter MgtE (Contains CBS domain) n=1 Tax=Actinacidiphila guanduensis TaxID=310781 RepID=A0A1H0A230_9ACTN|nr:CBS domain-containing protein [Actinacidiphila guanduensis]SDN27769.1 Mg/Co/Ni transporter MgtE (contains CBS domain) [Actinacidiphila guanduensis]
MVAGAPRVFVSHLSGVAVFDPNGDQVGRVRDVVVMLRLGGRPPRVLGLVVEVVGRRRIFLPMTRVTGVESGQVITTGVLNMRRFEQRPAETLVLGELLDRRVRLVAPVGTAEDGTAGGPGTAGTADRPAEEVTVLDVSMARLPARRDWEIDKVFVRRGKKGALRRRGEALTVDWSAVTGFSLAEEGQGAENLVATFEQLRPADLANVLHHLSPKRRGEVAAALDDDRLADVLEELPDDDQVEILSKLKEERAADVLEAMDPDDAADLLAELPLEEQERLLTLMEPQEAAGVRRLLSYEERTAGGLMTTEPLVLRADATVADALARIRNPDLPPALAAQVYVCRPPEETPTGKYLGLVHFQRLLRDPPFTLLGSIVDTDLQPLGPDTPLPSVTSYLATYNMVAAPVVDESGALLGAVTVDDVLDHLLPEDWRETDYRPPGADDGPDAGRDGGYGADDGDGSDEGDGGRPGRDEEQRVTEAADGR